ncbi:ABC transporter permease [Subtercola endophyticus]|uniref:ABC transporter permease n=1 Tax=Subtercola endophyticus TaxID=2895559 RepID=UPI001E3DFF77|nr:ABC transporter permease [Subtercola endophyticus]UFS57964.1 ABC transporter permease [Subtercola endophyticus]
MSTSTSTPPATSTSAPSPQTPLTHDFTSATKSRFSAAAFTERWALVGGLIVLVIACIIIFPQFRTASLFTTMINAQSLVLLLGLTATVILRLGDFDLSIAQTMVATGAIVAQLCKLGVPIPVAIASGLALGVVVGLVNALLVVRVGVDSFIATLGSFTALAGLSYLITNSRIISGIPDGFINFARSQILGIPMITWYAWILVIVLWYVYQRTPLGRYSLFIGGNRNAARLSGIPVNRIRAGAYVLSGLLASFIGICFIGYFGAVDPSVGGQYMLQPFAAAFLGATTIAVGRFNAFGTVAALYLLTVGITALQLLGGQTWVSNVFYGVALMVAVTAAKLAGNRRGGGQAK